MNLQAPEKIANYIAGDLAAPINGNYLDNVNPATGQVYGQIPDSDNKDVEEAVGAADDNDRAAALLADEPLDERLNEKIRRAHVERHRVLPPLRRHLR